LTKDDGGLFDLVDLDIDVVAGTDSDPGSVLGVSAPGFSERTFSASVDDQPLKFLSVSQVVFRHLIGPGVGIDNVFVRPVLQVPAPTTLVLVIGGLAGLLLGRRRGAVPERPAK
jgi:hypothetical protein